MVLFSVRTCYLKPPFASSFFFCAQTDENGPISDENLRVPLTGCPSTEQRRQTRIWPVMGVEGVGRCEGVWCREV